MTIGGGFRCKFLAGTTSVLFNVVHNTNDFRLDITLLKIQLICVMVMWAHPKILYKTKQKQKQKYKTKNNKIIDTIQKYSGQRDS
jgi:hypothetical protein